MLDWAAIGGISSTVSAVAALLAWRAVVRQDRRMLPYLDMSDLNGLGYIHLVGHDAEHWRIRSVRLLWPLKARLIEHTPVYDDGGSIIPEAGSRAAVGRVIRNYSGERISVDADGAVLLVTFASKTDIRCVKRTIARQKKIA